MSKIDPVDVHQGAKDGGSEPHSGKIFQRNLRIPAAKFPILSSLTFQKAIVAAILFRKFLKKACITSSPKSQ